MGSLIEFMLFAPGNEGAALIGSFSDWKEIPMVKSEDGLFTDLPSYTAKIFV